MRERGRPPACNATRRRRERQFGDDARCALLQLPGPAQVKGGAGRIAAADPGPHARVREGVGPVVGVIPGHVELGEVGCPVVLERRFQAEPGFQARTQRKAHAGPRPLCRLQGRLETLTEHIFRQALLRDGGAEGS